MDPTAPENNDQNTQNPQAPASPIQPGQFVVTSEENVNGQVATPPRPDTFASQQPPIPPQPTPASPYSQQATPDGFTANSFIDSNLQAQGPMPPAPAQPDPTPFAPPPQPVNPIAQPPGGDSKFGKVKIIGITAGIISLLIIIIALVWFFVLNKKTTGQQVTTSQDVIEEPSPTNQSSGSFGQINESTPQAQPLESPAPSQPSTPQTNTPPTQ